jgi:hypothetical protein
MKTDLIFNISKKLKTPQAVQDFLHEVDYNRDETLFSALKALKKGKAHCLEGVFIAAAILEVHSYEPWVLSLESQDGLDHCLFVYQQKGLWGAVGKSRDPGLCGRPPQYKTLRHLVWSYFDPYIDKTGKITAWQLAHLDEVASDWRRSPRHVWTLENHLLQIKHHKLVSSPRRYQKLFERYKKKGGLQRRPEWL